MGSGGIVSAVPYRQPCDYADCRELASVVIPGRGDDDYVCVWHARAEGLCEYDTGSATGCQPACSSRATMVGTYRNGSYGPFRVALCADHVRPMGSRVYPSPLDVVAL